MSGWRAVRTWAEMIKFGHSVFALPFALLATFLAARPRLPSWVELGLIVACMVAARSAAMTFNRLVDAAIDARNPRTSGRALPTGAIAPATAWLFFAAACTAFILATAGFHWLLGNPWPLFLCLPVLAFLCLYSYTKRFTRYSHLVLGGAIAFSPVGAWIAIAPATLGAPAWLLMLAVTFWIAGFDVIYACQDAEHDRAVGLRSLPSALGVGRALWAARAFHACAVAGLLGVGATAALGWPYFFGVACVAVLLIVENSLVHAHDLSRVNLAFFTFNGAVSLLLGALGILDIVVTRTPA